jgi:hypothetical protein
MNKMRKLLIVLLSAAILPGCAGGRNYVYAEVGHKLRGEWETGGSPTTGFGILRRDEDGRYCGYRHGSNILTGWPFNKHEESWIDQIVCGAEFEL